MLPIQVNKQAVLRGEIRSTLFEARKVAGSATYKQTEAVLSFRVKFVYSVYLFCLDKNNQSMEALSLLINTSSPKLHSAPLLLGTPQLRGQCCTF